MKFRYARHTNNLKALTHFYNKVIGLDVLGDFKNHANYNGVFLGLPHLDWHIEFTSTNEIVNHQPDADDLMVIYRYSEEEIDSIIKHAKQLGYTTVQPKNPYWQTHGFELKDPDGFGVILTLQDKPLDSKSELSQLVKTKNITNWKELVSYVKHIPYGRNESRTGFSEVLKNHKGTCSSKHALLKSIANENKIENVKLIIGIYKMDATNTPGIGNHLKENNLDYLPEAHCYLKVNGIRIDVTHPKADITALQPFIIEELEITPLQVGDFKVDYHKHFIKNWITTINSNLTFESVWKIIELCIESLSTNNEL